MSSFTTPLVVTPASGNRWKLVSFFEYHVGSFPSDEVIRVPAGFETDFASVPRLFWPIFPPYGATYGKAAVVHDFLWTQARSRQDLRRAAHVFSGALAVLGAPLLTRLLMVAAVQIYSELKPI